MRFLRLLIPLIFIGTFIINPLYVYIERLSSGETASGFFQAHNRRSRCGQEDVLQVKLQQI